MKRELVFLDTETTGNDVAKDRLAQVCYKTEKGIKNCYFKPPVPMSVKAMSVTHITNKMLEDKEPFIGSEMHRELSELLKDGILVAHNAKFDKAILEAEGIEVPRFIDTLRVSRFLDLENKIPEYNLQYLRYFLDLDIDAPAHDAEGDVKVLSGVFDRILTKMEETEGSRDKAIDKMIEISSKPSMFAVFNFGKHKDKKVSEVAKTDPGYLEWLLNQKLASGGEDEDWIYTLKSHLGK